MVDESTLRKLRKQLDKAQTKGRDEDAIDLLEQLIEAEPGSPRWPHKLGDLFRKVGRHDRAVDCYGRAVDLYAEQGFIARAVAMAKIVLNLDPKRLDILQRVDPQAAHALRKAAQEAAQKQAEKDAHHADPNADQNAAARRARRQPRGERPTRDRRPPAATAVRSAAGRPAQLEPAQQTAGLTAPAAVTAVAAPAAAMPHGTPQRGARPAYAVASATAAQAAFANATATEVATAPATAAQAANATATPAAGAPAPQPAAPPPLPPANAIAPMAMTLQDLSLPPRAAAHGPAMPAIPGAPRTPDVADVYCSVLAGIEELSAAPDAGADEVRFSNAPPPRRPSLQFELDIELIEEVEADELAPEDPQGVPSAVSLSRLPLFPLFAELPRPALARLVQRAELVELSDGQPLVQRGEPADALFGVVSGNARVLAPGRTGYLTLGEGAVIGEACLLQDEPRSADVVADGELTALRVSREALHEIVAEFPQMAELLLRLLTRRLLGNLLQTSPLFRDFDAESKRLVARSMEVRRARAGTVLCQTGKRVDGLYVALTGKLRVRAENRPEALWGPGSMFGQDAMLSHGPARCDIEATVNMVVLRLSAERFLPIAAQRPELMARLAELQQDCVVRIAS